VTRPSRDTSFLRLAGLDGAYRIVCVVHRQTKPCAARALGQPSLARPGGGTAAGATNLSGLVGSV